MNVMSGIRTDLRSILLTVAGLPTVQWQGRSFTPNADLSYVRERLVPVDSVTATLGNCGQAEDTILYTLDVFIPVRDPISDGENLVDAIRTAFWIGRNITVTGTDKILGAVRSAACAQMLEGPVHNQFPVTINTFVRHPLNMVF